MPEVTMHFSLFYNFDALPDQPVAELYRAVEEQAIAADRLGFDAIYLAEHHFALYGRLPAPLVYLARLSGLTRRIGLGAAVVEAPHYHPLRLAEDAALLDLLSGGRLRLGVGSGSRNKPAEFARFGIPLAEKSARTQEIVEILRQAFDVGLVRYAGRHYQFDDVPIDPRPLQPARDLIWLAASDGTVDLAGRAGYRLLSPRVISAERYHALRARYLAALGDQLGYIAQLRFVFVAETERAAQEQTRLLVHRYANYDLGVDWDGRTDTAEYRDILRRLNAVIGTPEQVIAELLLGQYQYDYDEVICQPYAAGVRPADAQRAIELHCSEVLPRLQTAALAYRR
jgi:alkanesulfonate monooxygenase SsuD/methylene tetrahydromethanopterin reductase-like flavin-dependent oxidoreductase (luciferase family)